jgi:hypothetical protein
MFTFLSCVVLSSTSRTLSANVRMVYENVEDFQVYELDRIVGSTSKMSCTLSISKAASEETPKGASQSRTKTTTTIKGKDRRSRGMKSMSSSSSSLTSLDEESEGEINSDGEEEEEEEELGFTRTPSRNRAKATNVKSSSSSKGQWNGLTVEGMIFIALCSGGDYHPVSRD